MLSTQDIFSQEQGISSIEIKNKVHMQRKIWSRPLLFTDQLDLDNNYQCPSITQGCVLLSTEDIFFQEQGI